MARSNLLPHAFVWALYIYMGKMLRIHILDISSIIQLNWNLMMSIRAPSRHKIAKLADRKSKMATTAAILKINFQHLFPNFWWLWAETCCVATGSKELKFCWMEFQDGHNGSTPLNKMAARATNRKSSNDISSWPVAWFQNICTEVFLQWPSRGGRAKVSCILCHRGIQLILAYSWERPAILVAGKGREVMFLFLLFLHFHSCSSFFPIPLFRLFCYLFCLFSPFLWETTQNDPQGLMCR